MTSPAYGPWFVRLWTVAAGLLGLLALASVLELADVVNTLWQTFPGVMGLRGVAGVVAISLAALAGLWLTLRLAHPWPLVFGLVLLIGLRVAVVLLTDPPLVRDTAAYDALARGVLAGECCFGERPMGYPLLVAAAYWVGLSGKVVNLLAGIASGVLVYILSRRLAGPRAAGAALYLYAIGPAALLLTGVLLTEPVYAALLLTSLWALSAGSGPMSGLLLGISQYVRATSIFLAPALLLPLVLDRAWRRAGLLAMGLLVALIPVIAATGGPSTSTLAGWAVLVGTNQEHHGRYNTADVELYNSWGEAAERLAREEALRRVLSDPVGFGSLVIRKLHVMWARDYYGVQFGLGAGVRESIRTPARLLSQAFYAAVLVAAAGALWSMRRAPPQLAMAMFAIVLTVAALHVFTEVQHRYHAYVVPLLIVLAVWHFRSARGSGGPEPLDVAESQTPRTAMIATDRHHERTESAAERNRAGL